MKSHFLQDCSKSKMHKCPACPLLFKRTYNLRVHIVRKHGEDHGFLWDILISINNFLIGKIFVYTFYLYYISIKDGIYEWIY